MKNFWHVVNDVIREADVILLVGDARLPEESFNLELFNKVMNSGKLFIYVLNKCDLLEKKYHQFDNTIPHLYVSAKEHLNTTTLYKKIREITKAREVIVGIVGYPNTGKSSLINTLKGKKSAPTSSQSGHTRGIQKIRINKHIVLLDTPGVIPYKERDAKKHSHIAAIGAHQVRDPENMVYSLLEKYPGLFEGFYNVTVDPDQDYENTMELISIALNFYKKGKVPDVKRTARKVLDDWQKGKIKVE